MPEPNNRPSEYSFKIKHFLNFKTFFMFKSFFEYSVDPEETWKVIGVEDSGCENKQVYRFRCEGEDIPVVL